MRKVILGVEEEAYFISYFDSTREREKVHGVL